MQMSIEAIKLECSSVRMRSIFMTVVGTMSTYRVTHLFRNSMENVNSVTQ